MFHFPTFGLKDMLPGKAVISKRERKVLESIPLAQIKVTAAPLVPHPVIPFQIFGLDYEKDIVIATDHPQWNLHEYAQVRLPEGPVWIMKDALEGTLDQYIAMNRGDLLELIPEIPLNISVQEAQVTDNSTEQLLDMVFEYKNHLGEKVKASYQGKTKLSRMRKRNGSTMGHSKNQLLVVLDLPGRRFGKKASISYDGQNYPVKKLLGIMPFQMLVQQTQGGMATGSFTLKKGGPGLLHTYHPAEKEIIQDWQIVQDEKRWTVIQENRLRTVLFQFEKSNESLHLSSANVQLWDRNHPAFELHFFPNLPDLRTPFSGQVMSTFVMDVNGQKNHGIGKIYLEWEEEKLNINIKPEKPRWIADRPMEAIVDFSSGEKVQSVTRMVVAGK